MDENAMREELRSILKRNREAFEGKYRSEIDELLGLSREDLDELTPDTTDLATYDALIEVVKEASRQNASQAELKDRIREMGDLAVKIARKAPRLAPLFV